MRRLKVSVIVFIFSWYLAILGVDLFATLGFTGTTLAFFQSNMVLFAMASYTQSFYVFLWRSSEYRIAFFKMWSCCFPNSRAQKWMKKTARTTSLPSNNYISTLHRL
uniref:Uncharacterized protein n=1 Tax=Caenorhabditis japonica TaxID=281687 RepID=A0A8R1HSP2_CAEJA